MKKISVVGAGTMGNGIAHHLATFNFDVTLVDLSEERLEKARKTIAKNLDRQIKKQIVDASQKEKILSQIEFATSISKIDSSDLVIEAVNENPDLKTELFKQIETIISPNAIIASNTSSISITELAKNVENPERTIGMHFMNPVPVMKLVEIIKGYKTNDSTLNKIVDLTKKIDKQPVIVNDYPGFISNRVLMPMINEAICALYEGVAGVKEIDTIMKLGMAHPMGPLQLADYIGLDVCLSILRVLYNGFGNPKYAPCPLLQNMVNAGNLGIKSGEGFYWYNNESKELTVSYTFLK